LRQVQAAAANLAEQAGIAQGKTQVVVRTVTDNVSLASAAIGGTLGTIHLWKTLFPRHREKPHDDPQPAGSDHSPPHRRGPPAATAFADRYDGHEHQGHIR
jgi:hypothetical protein